MFIKDNFNIKVNASFIRRILNPNNQEHIEDHINRSLTLLADEFNKHLKPSVSYIINEERVHVFATLGDGFDKLNEALWQADEYFDAVVLDHVSNQILFDLSEEFYAYIKTHFSNQGKSLSSRQSPGDNIAMEKNFEIIQHFKGFKTFQGSCNDYNTLLPIKSLAYYYNILDSKDYKSEDINCNSCKNATCLFKRQSI